MRIEIHSGVEQRHRQSIHIGRGPAGQIVAKDISVVRGQRHRMLTISIMPTAVYKLWTACPQRFYERALQTAAAFTPSAISTKRHRPFTSRI